MIHFSKDGTILDCNDMFVELMGSSRKKLIGFNTPKQTKNQKLRTAITKALAGEPAEYEGDYTSVTGNKTASLRIVFSPTEPGESPTEVIATLEDITERKRAEEAIRESRERLDTILKTTAQGFWLNDQEDNIIDVNEAMCEILGLAKEEITGRNFSDFLNEENREIVREQNRIRKKGKQSLYEISLLRPDGTLVPCLNNAEPLLDGEGNVIGSFGMLTDITERKEAEKKLKESEERHRTLLKRLPESVVVYDMEGKTLYVNPVFEKTFGWSRDEVLGKNIDFVPPELEAETRSAIQKMLTLAATDEALFFETRRLTKNGDSVDVQISTAPFHDPNGRQMGNIVILNDITERKRAEDELNRNIEELERFSKVAYGREKKMIQLKQEINELMVQLGQGEKYKIVK